MRTNSSVYRLLSPWLVFACGLSCVSLLAVTNNDPSGALSHLFWFVLVVGVLAGIHATYVVIGSFRSRSASTIYEAVTGEPFHEES